MTVNIIGRSQETSGKSSVHYWTTPNSRYRLSHRDADEGEAFAAGWIGPGLARMCHTIKTFAWQAKEVAAVGVGKIRNCSQAVWADIISWRRSGWPEARMGRGGLSFC